MRNKAEILSLFLFFTTMFSFAAETTPSSSKNKRWALIIGINNYQNRFIENLSMPRYDAKLIEDTLKNEGKFDIVIRMTDDVFHSSPNYPSKKNIFSILKQITEEAQENDSFVFFFSGYSIFQKENEIFLLTVDSNLNNIEESALPFSSISKICTLKNMKNSLFLIDGSRLSGPKQKGINLTSQKFNSTIFPGNSIIFFATSEQEFTADTRRTIYAPYGIFAYHLCFGLRGAADSNADGIIHIDELISYVKQQAILWSIWHPERQTPQEVSLGNFDFHFPIGFTPLLARPVFDPYKVDDSFYRQNLYFHLVNYISLSSFLTSLSIFTVGITICAFGLSQVIGHNFTLENFILVMKNILFLPNSIENDLLQSGSVVTLLGALFTLISFIPYFISFHLDLQKISQNQVSLVTSIKDNCFRIGISLKTKKI